jgi:hypothetical protein
MNQYYAEFRCLAVAFALWGNRCQSLALTDTDGTIIECHNPLFVLDPEAWWHQNQLDQVIKNGPDPKGIARRLRKLTEIIHQAHILLNKPVRPDEGIWQIRQAAKANPTRNKELIRALEMFDETARRCKSRIRYLLAKLDYFDGTPWPAGEAAIEEWEAEDALGSSERT